MVRSLSAFAVATVLATAVGSGIAAAQSRTEVGVLRCDVSGGIGMIVTSKKQMACTFSPAGGGPRESYVGSISKFGLDIGATSSGRMVWTVFAATRGNEPPSLSGTYGGASAEATAGAGLGANVLVGGSNRSIALQPVSIQGQTGLNLAVGVADLELRQSQ